MKLKNIEGPEVSGIRAGICNGLYTLLNGIIKIDQRGWERIK